MSEQNAKSKEQLDVEQLKEEIRIHKCNSQFFADNEQMIIDELERRSMAYPIDHDTIH